MSNYFNGSNGNGNNGSGTDGSNNNGERKLKEWQLDVRPEVALKQGKESYKLSLRFIPNIFEDNKYQQGILERKEFNYKNPIDGKDYAVFNDNTYLTQMEIPFLQMIENKFYSLSDSNPLKTQLKLFAKSSSKNACVAYVLEDKITPEQQGTFKISPIDKDTKKIYNTRKKAGRDMLDLLNGCDFKMKSKNKANPDNANKPFVVFDGSEFEDDSTPFEFVALDGSKKTFTQKELDYITSTMSKVKSGESKQEDLLKSPLYALLDAKFPKDKIGEFAPQKANDEILDKFARIVAIIFAQYKTSLEEIMATATDMSHILNLKYQSGSLILSGQYAQKNALGIVNKNTDFVNRIYRFMNNQQPTSSQAQSQPQGQQSQSKPVYNAAPTPMLTNAFNSEPTPEDDLPF